MSLLLWLVLMSTPPPCCTLTTVLTSSSAITVSASLIWIILHQIHPVSSGMIITSTTIILLLCDIIPYTAKMSFFLNVCVMDRSRVRVIFLLCFTSHKSKKPKKDPIRLLLLLSLFSVSIAREKKMKK